VNCGPSVANVNLPSHDDVSTSAAALCSTASTTTNSCSTGSLPTSQESSFFLPSLSIPHNDSSPFTRYEQCCSHLLPISHHATPTPPTPPSDLRTTSTSATLSPSTLASPPCLYPLCSTNTLSPFTTLPPFLPPFLNLFPTLFLLNPLALLHGTCRALLHHNAIRQQAKIRHLNKFLLPVDIMLLQSSWFR